MEELRYVYVKHTCGMLWRVKLEDVKNLYCDNCKSEEGFTFVNPFSNNEKDKENEEFNLSECIIDLYCKGENECFCNWIHVTDVQEFVKRVKEELIDNGWYLDGAEEIINKLAGDKIVKEDNNEKI